MSKFKVGDKVRILDGSKINNYTGGWTDLMSEHLGESCTIKAIQTCHGGRIAYTLDLTDICKICMWDERGLELAGEQKIVITTNGRVTKAALYEDKQRIKVATAKCHPGDKFDFAMGAALALERLTGHIYGKIENTIASFDWNGFKAGEFEVIVNRDNIERFLKECEENNIEWPNYKATAWNPIKRFDESSSIVKMIMTDILNFESTDKTWLKVDIDSKLHYSFNSTTAEKTVVYD